MILDKNTLFADDLAYDGPAAVIDLQAVGAGKGEKLKIFVQGSSDLATCTGVAITDGATDTAADPLLTYVCALAGETVEIDLPSDVARYVTVALTTATTLTAGTWTAGIVLPGVQTAA